MAVHACHWRAFPDPAQDVGTCARGRSNITASTPTWVTISDLYFPGWEARSDDKPLRIWRANGLYRAVCVPAGEHRVRFDFSPFKFIRSALH